MKNYEILKTIGSPSDIKRLSTERLNTLADEIRRRIIEVVSSTGGHLASSLGAVEILIALHKVFKSPEDKFIFDVGHQSYAHKLLTGRNDGFETLRQYKGLCGFPHPEESDHDHFHAGHAGTALSIALGIAKNRELTGRREYILPIIGDATLTCGLTLEALNNIPRSLSRFIVILNDNAMAISKNVGAITQILSRFLNNPTANKIYNDIEAFISKIPTYGTAMAKQSQKIKESVKNLVSQASFFEHYNLSYIGPIDGHDIKKLVDTLTALKDSSHPVILHVVTKKGKGLEAAMKNPTNFHGAAPFNPITGEFFSSNVKKPSFPQIFGKQLLKMANNDPSIVAVTPAMSKGSCLDAFMRKFPERCLDVGIAEGHAITYSGGIAYGKKMKVVACIYSTFLQRALDNVFIDICLQKLPVILAVDRGGLSAADGVTHHGIYDIAFLKTMPNMLICQPRDGHVFKELLESAFSWKRPVAIRYPNMPTKEFDLPIRHRKIACGEVLAEGKEILIIALGHMCQTALEIRKLMKEKGYSITVLDPIFIKPLDADLLDKLMMTHNKIITIEEHAISGGLATSVNHFLLSNGFSNVQVLNFGIPDEFIGHGSYMSLIKNLELTPEQITQKIIEDFSLHNMTSAKSGSI